MYRRSHVLPSDDDPRGGSLDLGLIPGFITRDGRDRTGAVDAPDDDEGVWPWLRVSLRPVQPPAEARRLARRERLYRHWYRWWRRRVGRHLGLAAPSWSWPEDTVILDRNQVEALRDELTDWLLRCDDVGAWMEQYEARRRGKS